MGPIHKNFSWCKNKAANMHLEKQNYSTSLEVDFSTRKKLSTIFNMFRTHYKPKKQSIISSIQREILNMHKKWFNQWLETHIIYQIIFKARYRMWYNLHKWS